MALTPDAVALIHEALEGEEAIRVTYDELNARANRLAAYLSARDRSRPLRPNALVVLFFDRSIDLIVCLLAVLKCGAYYLALETENPDDRCVRIIF